MPVEQDGVVRQITIVYFVLIILCVMYFVYANATARSFEGSLTKVCKRIDDPFELFSTSDSPDRQYELGTKHSLSYMISNPLQVAHDRRVQRLDVLNQLLVGIRHFSLDLVLFAPDKAQLPVDSRLRTIEWSNEDRTVVAVPLIVANHALTDYNMLDFLDVLQDYVQRVVRVGDGVHVWIDRMYRGDDEMPVDDEERARVRNELVDYVRRIDPALTRRLLVERDRPSDNYYSTDGGTRVLRWLNNAEDLLT